MPVIKTAAHLAHEAVATAYTAARHPISAAAVTAGFVKGVAASGIALVHGRPAADASADASAGASAEAATGAPASSVPPQRVPVDVPEIDELPELIVIEADDTPGEAFHTEPKASSRDSDHGGQPGDREEAEGYAEEIVLPDEDLDEPAELVFTSESAPEASVETPVADPETVEAIHRVAEASQVPQD